MHPARLFAVLPLLSLACHGPEDTGDSADTAVGSQDLVWPNEESSANSDSWLPEHHADITRMEPRVLALNFVNARTNEEMLEHFEEFSDVMAEASRYHGYADESAEPFLVYDIAYDIDLTDDDPPEDWAYNNSTLYPREDPVDGYWGFDYEALFTDDFAELMGIGDPESPGEVLDLCTLVDRGLVNEVWIYGDADVPDVSAAEVLEMKPYYDADRNRLDEGLNRCAGNGCFDDEDEFPDHCTRSLRIAWFNNTRGQGCFMESLSHGFESMGAWNEDLLPSLSKDFRTFANHGLDERYDISHDSWYSCAYGETCLSYPTPDAVSWSIGGETGTIEDYDPVCGMVHFMPNGREHYDLYSEEPVESSCTHYGLNDGESGEDAVETFSVEVFDAYWDLAPDCMGPFLVWWRQNFPGYGNPAVDDQGDPILNWWVYLYY